MTDQHREQLIEAQEGHMRVRAMMHNICFIAKQQPTRKYLVPMVQSFDFKNFETKLAEIIEQIANDN